MRSRHLPGSTVRLSEIGAAFGQTGNPHTGWVESQGSIHLLRRLRLLGMTYLDISGASDAAAWRHCLREAFPIEDSELTVAVEPPEIDRLFDLTGESNGERPATRRGVGAALEHALAEVAAQIGKVKIGIVIVRAPDRWTPTAEPLMEALSELVSGATIQAWGIDCTGRAAESEALESALGHGAGVVSLPLSLLNNRVYSQIMSKISLDKVGILARDPHAGGRLDGTWFAANPLAGGLGQSPRRVSELESEYQGVLKLGFLTADHHRTLAQAAVQFCLAQPGVVSVVLDSPSIELAESLTGLAGVPPIPPGDLVRVSRIASG